jgi:hypothetical protein
VQAIHRAKEKMTYKIMPTVAATQTARDAERLAAAAGSRAVVGSGMDALPSKTT